jgi:glutamine amidotransferase
MVQYGGSAVTAAVWQGRVGACQFHPEKSSDAGQKLLRRWLVWLAAEGTPSSKPVDPVAGPVPWS